MISHLFFDVGGVLGTSGRGSDARARALGMHALRFTTADGLRHELAALGVQT